MSGENTAAKKAETKGVGKVRNRVLTVVALLIFIGLGVWYYFYWQGQHYLVTDNAKVTASLYTVTSQANGKLDRLNVAQGVIVSQDDTVARIEDGPKIKAPVSGQVIKCDVSLGQLVSPATAVAIIAETSTACITANIDETLIRKIKEGQAVDVTLDAYPGKTFKAHISSVQQITDAALKGTMTSLTTSGTYTKVVQQLPVKITLDDDVYLADIIGTNATVKITLK